VLISVGDYVFKEYSGVVHGCPLSLFGLSWWLFFKYEMMDYLPIPSAARLYSEKEIIMVTGLIF